MGVSTPNPGLFILRDSIVIIFTNDEIYEIGCYFTKLLTFGFIVFYMKSDDGAFVGNRIYLRLTTYNFSQFLFYLNFICFGVQLTSGRWKESSFWSQEVKNIVGTYNIGNVGVPRAVESLWIRKWFGFHPIIFFQVKNEIVFHF